MMLVLHAAIASFSVSLIRCSAMLLLCAVAAHIKTTPTSFAKFAEWVSDPTFLPRLAKATANPLLRASSTLLKQIMPNITVASAKVPYSTAHRKAAMGHLYAMVYHFGVPSIFFTFAPDDVHGILNMCLALPQANNWDFPSNGEGFAAALRHGEEKFHGYPIGERALSALLAAGPVAAAEIYRQMVENVFSVLLGTPPDETSRQTQPLPSRDIGVFGIPVASFGVTEEQARGSLHMHIVTWGSLPPRLLQQAEGIPGLVSVIARALDTLFSATLDPDIHIQGLLRHIKGTRSPCATFFKCHNPLTEQIEFKQDVDRCIDMANVHRHSATCCKPPNGKRACRLAQPAPISPVTGCVQIEPILFENKTILYYVLPHIQSVDPLTTVGRNMSTVPITNSDRRLIVWELYRPQILPLPPQTQETNIDDLMYIDDVALLIAADSIQQPLNEEHLVTDAVAIQSETLNISTDIQSMLDQLSSAQHVRVSNAFVRRNGLVVEYNPVISGLLGCNTAVYLHGSEIQVLFLPTILSTSNVIKYMIISIMPFHTNFHPRLYIYSILSQVYSPLC